MSEKRKKPLTTAEEIKQSAIDGYFVDLFFLDHPLQLIQDNQFLRSIQTALQQANLKIDNLVSQREFTKATRSVPVNRYARMPKRMLANYDERVFSQNTLEAITYDPAKSKESQAMPNTGHLLEKDVHFENAFFHNVRYMSTIAVRWGKYTVIKVSYNYKLHRVAPEIADVTAFTGIVLTSILNCAGIYTRAGSFARSEEFMAYIYAGDIKDQETGNDTVFGYVEEAKLLKTHGINIRDVMDYMDNQVAIHYSIDDMSEIEKIKKTYFQNYKIDKTMVYQKLDKIMDDWFKRENREAGQIIRLVRQMLDKEADLDIFKGQNKNFEEEIGRAAMEIAEILIQRHAIKRMMDSESNVRDFYWKVDPVSSHYKTLSQS